MGKISNLVKKSVAAMAPYDASAAAGASCKLDQNESPYDVPASVKKRILRRLANANFNRYPSFTYSKLRSRIAGIYGLKASNVAVGSGIDDLLYCLTLAFVEKGDRVLYFTPTFGMYRICCRVSGAREMAVPLNKDFGITPSFIRKARRAKLVFLCRPNNPTGNSIPIAQVEKIVQNCPGMVCIDEAYADFADDNCLSLLKYDNVIVMRTLSKAFCGAGIRVGYALGQEGAIAALNKVRLPWNLSVFSQIAAEELLRSRAVFQKMASRIKSERARVLSQLRLLGMEAYESQANFILFKAENAGLLFKRLLANGVLVRRFSSPSMEGYLRMNIGTPRENDCFLRSLLQSAVDSVLFDIDGTLVDVSRSYNEAIRLAAEKLSGKRASMRLVREVKSCVGMNNDWDATIEVLRRMGTKASRQQVVPIFQGIYFGEGGEGLIRKEKLLVGRELLRKIKTPVGIVTGRPRAEAGIAMRLLGLPKNTPLVAMEDTKKGKPDPAPLLLAKKRMGTRLPLYIGDSPDDLSAAQAAGFAFVAIGKGKKKDGEFARFADVNAAIRGLLL